MLSYKEIKKAMKSNDLVEANLRLVLHLAKKYQGMGLDYEDLVNEGTIGLCVARDKYDESKGKFSSYAALWIKAYIRQALNNKSRTIRKPSHLATVEGTNLNVQELDSSYQGVHNPEVETTYEEDHQTRLVKKLLTSLKPKNAEIIKMKFGIDCEEMKTAEIAKALGLTVQAVNGTIRNSLAKMKDLV